MYLRVVLSAPTPTNHQSHNPRTRIPPSNAVWPLQKVPPSTNEFHATNTCSLSYNLYSSIYVPAGRLPLPSGDRLLYNLLYVQYFVDLTPTLPPKQHAARAHCVVAKRNEMCRPPHREAWNKKNPTRSWHGIRPISDGWQAEQSQRGWTHDAMPLDRPCGGAVLHRVPTPFWQSTMMLSSPSPDIIKYHAMYLSKRISGLRILLRSSPCTLSSWHQWNRNVSIFAWHLISLKTIQRHTSLCNFIVHTGQRWQPYGPPGQTFTLLYLAKWPKSMTLQPIRAKRSLYGSLCPLPGLIRGGVCVAPPVVRRPKINCYWITYLGADYMRRGCLLLRRIILSKYNK